MSSTVMTGEIPFAFNGLMVTDTAFTYDKVTGTLSAANISTS